MTKSKSIMVIATILVAFCLSTLAFAENTSPNITSVIPDRAAAGDTITINGENLGIAGDEVEVNFGSGVKVSVAPGGSSLSCTVPVGADTGEISLKITRTLSNGTTETYSSNSMPFQVVWKTFDLTPVLSNLGHVQLRANPLSQGKGDNFSCVPTEKSVVIPGICLPRFHRTGTTATTFSGCPLLKLKRSRNPGMYSC